jgi:hypothetical protein
MYQSHRHESDVTIVRQETIPRDPLNDGIARTDELPEAALAAIVGGTEGPPTGAGDHNGVRHQ